MGNPRGADRQLKINIELHAPIYGSQARHVEIKPATIRSLDLGETGCRKSIASLPGSRLFSHKGDNSRLASIPSSSGPIKANYFLVRFLTFESGFQC
jgi:hypothetical protein